jgi:fatty acid amide hydrolase
MLKSDRATELTDFGATELAGMIAAGEASSTEVVSAHIQRIEAVNGQLNAVVAPLFDQALKSASQADSRRARGEPVGPLNGVPMTIKECYDVAGLPTTTGLKHLAHSPAAADAPVVRQFRDAGAVFLGKTNVPHLLIFNEGDNPLYGRTNNPWDLERSPGGGSSGEGAIISARGSPLGLATDYGGSIRIPPDYCGLLGFKPTSGRFTMRGTFDDKLFPGLETVINQPGAIARSVADLELALRVMRGPGVEIADQRVQQQPWGDSATVSLKSLRVAFYPQDDVYPVAPVKRRAVREAAAALVERGVEVEEFLPPDIRGGQAIFLGLLSAGGSGWAKVLAAGDRLDKRSGHPLMLMELRHGLLPFLSGVASLLGQKNAAAVMGSGGRRSAASYLQLIVERDRYRERFLAALERGRYDAIVCPSNPFPAYRHGASYWLLSEGSYTQVYNLLGLPTGHVAATRVRPGEESDRARNRDLIDRTARLTEEGSAGLPAGVQVVARPWREDVALAVMAALEEHFKSQPDYPARPPI